MRQFLYCLLAATILPVAASDSTATVFLFDLAAHGQGSELCAILNKRGIGPDEKILHGQTLLMHAAYSNNPGPVRALFELGADIRKTDEPGRDALDIALLNGSLLAARVLVDCGADIDMVNASGHTRLTLCVLRNDLASVHFLLTCGANPDKPSKNGITAMNAGKKCKNPAILKLLDDPSIRGVAPPVKRSAGVDAGSIASKLLAGPGPDKPFYTRTFTSRSEFASEIQDGRRSFKGCGLVMLDLSNMNLAALDLSQTDMTGCDLRSALLKDTALRGANFNSAYLKRADLRGADITDADFSGAYLNEADLTGTVGLSAEQLRVSRNLFNTRMDPELIQFVKERQLDKLKDPGSTWDTNPWIQESRN